MNLLRCLLVCLVGMSGAPLVAAQPVPPPPTSESDVQSRPADEQEKRRALKAMMAKQGHVKVEKGTALCTHAQTGRAFRVEGVRRRDGRVSMTIYQATGGKFSRLKGGKIDGYITKAEGNKGGIEVTYEDPSGDVVSYNAFECKLKLK